MAEKLFLPELPSSPMFLGEKKVMTVEWQEFFRTLFDRVGGLSGPNSTDLLISMVSELYSTPTNYNKRINDLEKEIVSEALVSTPFVFTGSLTFDNAGLHILDTNNSHDLIISPGSDLTEDRTLTFTTGDASRIITLLGDPTLNDWFDQGVKTTDSPSFVAVSTDTVQARSASGLKLYEDGGDGIFIQNGGRIGFGTNAPTLDYEFVDLASRVEMGLITYSATDDTASRFRIRKSAQDTEGRTTTGDGERIGEIRFEGVGTNFNAFVLAAKITVFQNGGASDDYIPSDLFIETEGDAGINSDQLVLHHDGGIGIYTTSPDTVLQVVGDVKIGDDNTNYLTVDTDGDISFTGTARIDWAKITANGVTLGDGPPTSADSVSDLQTAHDGNTYEVAEIAANAGQYLIVDFTSVTAFNWVQIFARYSGQAGSHGLTVMLEITPFDGSAWHVYDHIKDQASNTNFQNYSFFVPDDSAYINSGVVKVKFEHEMNGNAADDWYFDVVALYQ